MSNFSTAFLTDQYELTMLSSTLKSGIADRKAVFELFSRKLHNGRTYGVIAGTERAIQAVENFTFTPEQSNFLREHRIVDEDTINYLENFHFNGKITGYKEGSVFFPYSPILTVEGTFGECVLLETILLSIFNYDSAVATASARMVQAAQNGNITLLELGARRAHEQAAVAASRAAYLTGFKATANLEAGLLYGIPTAGTSAHAFTLAHPSEEEAFTQQISTMGESTTLLVDTYNIRQGIENAIRVGGKNLGGVRIDSGNFHEEALKARAQLDDAGLTNTKIVLSSDIDEFVIDELIERNTPIDVVGAGTRVVTGSGVPTAGMVYKLVAIEGENGTMKPVAKKASGKKSIGGKKIVRRTINSDTGEYTSETVTVDATKLPAVDGLVTINPVVTLYSEGKRITGNVLNVHQARDHHAQEMKRLPGWSKSVQSQTQLAIPTYLIS